MLEESLVVSSAVSAFNNAALLAPAFLWNAVLCIPLFILVFWFGRVAASRLGLVPYITLSRATFWTVLLTVLWCVLMGDNYGALRDGMTVLPWVLAAVLFFGSLFVGGGMRAIKLPVWYGASNAPKFRRWLVNALVVVAILIPVATSDLQNLWVGAMQVSAICAGFLVGRVAKRQVNGMFCLLAIMLTVTTTVLMQPEFFRFGQLGNLTPMHLLWTLLTGLAIAIAVALNAVTPSGRVHDSAYIKLKWLFRLLAGLCAVLFLLTESVPMLLAATALVFVLAALSVWHAPQVAPQTRLWAVAAAIVLFGVLIGVPTITCIGLLLIAANGRENNTLPWFLL